MDKSRVSGWVPALHSVNRAFSFACCHHHVFLSLPPAPGPAGPAEMAVPGQRRRLPRARAPGSTSLEKREGVGGVVGGQRGQEDSGASPSRAHAAGSKAGLPASSGWISLEDATWKVGWGWRWGKGKDEGEGVEWGGGAKVVHR